MVCFCSYSLMVCFCLFSLMDAFKISFRFNMIIVHLLVSHNYSFVFQVQPNSPFDFINQYQHHHCPQCVLRFRVHHFFHQAGPAVGIASNQQL